jgi:hypothetical protein
MGVAVPLVKPWQRSMLSFHGARIISYAVAQGRIFLMMSTTALLIVGYTLPAFYRFSVPLGLVTGGAVPLALSKVDAPHPCVNISVELATIPACDNQALCGFRSEFYACQSVLLSPLLDALQRDTFVWVLNLVLVFCTYNFLVGRGIFKFHVTGEDHETIDWETLREPQVTTSLICCVLNCIQSVLRLTRMALIVPLLMEVRLGGSTGLTDELAFPIYPATCYDQCDTLMLNFFYACMVIVGCTGNVELLRKCLCFDNTLKHSRLAAREKLLSDGELAVLHAQARSSVQKSLDDSLEGGDAASGGGVEGKFASTANELIVGQAKEAALGVRNFMGVSSHTLDQFRHVSADRVRETIASTEGLVDRLDGSFPGGGFARVCELLEGTKAMAGVPPIIQEFVIAGTQEDWMWLEYVVGQPAKELQVDHGTRDFQRNGQRLIDFVNHPAATMGKLEAGHVLALRMYTTAAYKSLNNPLRDHARDDEGRTLTPPRMRADHGLPLTIKMIEEGLKFLRAVSGSVSLPNGDHGADVDEGHQEDEETSQALWRGMKNLQVNDAFMQRRVGGTELAPMSTTEDLQVAAWFSASANSLLFKFRVDSFMQRGANLQWLSAFPKERETLYPPLTYLKPTGKTQVVEVPVRARVGAHEDSASPGHASTTSHAAPNEVVVKYTVVEIVPHFPS